MEGNLASSGAEINTQQNSMIWLASYPRSGNTFFRNVMFELYGMESCDYHREKNYKVVENYTSFPVVKTHLLPWQITPTGPEIKSIYLVRDGRDALVSMAHQRKDIVAPGSDFNENLRLAIIAAKGSYFGGWTENVRQWVQQADLILRYEDMIADPRSCFERVRKLLNLPEPDYSKIPTFEQLKYGDPKYGSGKKHVGEGYDMPDYAKKFFRKGKAGGWKDDMTDEMHDLFWSYHGEMMEHLGYRYDGTFAELNQDIDRAVIHKLELPLKVETKKKVLIEASKLLLWFNEGTKRYLVELLKGLLEVTEAPESCWDIDVYVGGKIYSLKDCHDFLHKDAVLENYMREYQAGKAAGISGDTVKNSVQGKHSGLLGTAKRVAKKIIREVKRSYPYQLYFHSNYYLRKYPARFKWYSLWYRGLRKLGLMAKMTDLSQYDVIHLPLMQNYYPFRNIKGNYVVTIHDLTHLYFPQFHRKENIDCCNEAMRFVQENNAEIIAISESTRRDYVKETNINANRVHVIYEAADRRKFRIQFDKGEIQKTLDNYRIPDTPFLLCLSTLEPRKNLVNTIKAFVKFIETYPEANLNLVIAGKNGWKNDELFNLDVKFKNRILFTGFVADEDLPKLYSAALGLSYVSYYEGFGLPPLEAMSCRTPVIYGNNSSMIEVVGDAGYKAEAGNVDDIMNQIKLLYFDKGLREKKAGESLKRSFMFSWRNTILHTLEVYKNTGSGKPFAKAVPTEKMVEIASVS